MNNSALNPVTKPPLWNRRLMVVVFFIGAACWIYTSSSGLAGSTYMTPRQNAALFGWGFSLLWFLWFVLKHRSYLLWGDPLPVQRGQPYRALGFLGAIFKPARVVFDERDIEVRHRAFVRSHQLLAATISLLFLYDTVRLIAWSAGIELTSQWFGFRYDPANHIDQWKTIANSLLFVAVFLPTLILLWTDPDPGRAED